MKNTILLTSLTLIFFASGCATSSGPLPTEKFSSSDATKVEKKETCGEDDCACKEHGHSMTKKEADEAGIKCNCGCH